MSNIAAKVTVVHRRAQFRAERVLQQRLFARKNIEVVWNAVVEDILGSGTPPSASGVKLRDVTTGAVTERAADGIFVAIGHEPATELVKGQVRLKPNGYVWTEPNSTRTSVAGVFAAGDVTDDVFRQAVTAAGMGCMAAIEAEKYLSEIEVSSEAAE